MSERISQSIALLAMVWGTACAHDAVFAPAPPAGAKAPRDSGASHVVTLNTGADLFPNWLPDGSALAYAFDSHDSPPFPLRCAGLIPPEGGTRTTLACKLRSASDSIDEIDWPAAGPGGALVYAWAPYRKGFSFVPDSTLIIVSSLAHPADAQSVFTFPYTSPSAVRYTTVTHLAWLVPSTFIGTGAVAAVTQNCVSCPFRTVYAGRDVLRFDVTTRPATVTAIPNTSPATSVAVGDSGDIYFTRMGDSRVFRRILATGDSSVVHDFGAAGIARDVQVAAGRLVAIVGGHVSLGSNPVIGVFQEDSGGYIHVVTLANDSDTSLPDSAFLFRHPALSPTADRLVAEAWRQGTADLWFIRLP